MNEFKIKNGAIVAGSITGITEPSSENSAKMASTSWVRNHVAANGGSISSTKTLQSFTATAGQTSFTITNGYTPGLLDIYLNGSFLNTSEYTATDGSAVVLTNAASVDDIVDVVKTNAFYVGTSPNARESYLYTATASQTTFAATYTPGQVDVFYNGAKLAPAEFTATNGTSVVLTTAATSGDVVEIMGWLTGGGLTGTRTLTINGTTYDLSANRSWTVTDATKLPLSGGILTGNLTATQYSNTSSTAFLLASGNNNDFRLNSASDVMRVVNAANTAALMTIINSGYIGIGTTTPENNLQLGRVFGFAQDINSGYIQANMANSGNYIVSQYAVRIHLDSALGEIKFLTSASGTAGAPVSLLERVRINQTGSVVCASSVTASSIIKTGGTSAQFLKADGSVDSTTYAPNTFYAIDMLIVGGGGGGGGAEMSNGYGGGGAGGGAGGYLAGAAAVTNGSTYAVVIGAGGAGGISRLNADGGGLPGSNGMFSSAFGLVSIGGGQGQGEENNPTGAGNGGSGGGKGGDSGSTPIGTATPGQGNNGGSNGTTRSGGGGGGANTSGGTAVPNSSGGLGGNGLSWLNGTVYACGGGGGGGGGVVDNAAGGNSSVNGGRGSRSTGGGGTMGEGGGNATAGSANTGTGGGGAGAGYLQGGQNGGSGVVIIRYAGAQRGTGGTVTTIGSFTYHTFTSSGTFTA